MTDLLYIILSILMLIGIFVLVYLKGKSVQMAFSGIGEALDEKEKKKDLIGRLIRGYISVIDVNNGQKTSIHITDVQAIDKFKQSLEKHEIYKLRMKERYDGPTFDIYVSGNKHTLVSYLSPNHQEDVFTKLSDKYEKYYIKFPGLKRWLDDNVLSVQKDESGR